MTDTTNTNATQAAALAVRDAAAALARRLPLYYGSGEPADEDLAQAIEDLPLPDADTADWKAEAERLRGLLRREQQERHAVLDRLDAAILARTASQAQAEQYLAERDEARAELAQAREVLSRLEWDSWGYDPHAEGRSHCPCCGWTKDEGHAPDCALDAALAAKGE